VTTTIPISGPGARRFAALGAAGVQGSQQLAGGGHGGGRVVAALPGQPERRQRRTAQVPSATPSCCG